MSLIRLPRNIAKQLPLYRKLSTAVLNDEEYTATPNYPPILDLSPEKVLEHKKEASYEELRNVKTIEEKLLNDEEYTATPNYPPILDLSPEKVLEHKKEASYEELRNVKTIEEKQIKLNMPKYYGFKCYMFDEGEIPYGQLPLVQHITRTHLILKDELPEYYNQINVDDLVSGIKSDIEEVLVLEYNHYRRKHDVSNEEIDIEARDRLLTRSICHQINRSLMNNMSRTFSHLQNAQIDLDPRIESFWFAGGMDPPENIKKYRRGMEWQKHKENEPTNRAIQYIGTPLLHLRSRLPLLPIIAFKEATNEDFKVPFFKYDPRVVGTLTTHRHVTNIPGFWPGDSYEHGLLSYHSREHLINRNFPHDNVDALHRQGILASFGWLNAQANYLGFTTYNDITYPLVTQCA
ncbi:hypothetical protein AMK59_2522, partial [Oryctes borbonicus]